MGPDFSNFLIVLQGSFHVFLPTREFTTTITYTSAIQATRNIALKKQQGKDSSGSLGLCISPLTTTNILRFHGLKMFQREKYIGPNMYVFGICVQMHRKPPKSLRNKTNNDEIVYDKELQLLCYFH
jgi:hypothetical protein